MRIGFPRATPKRIILLALPLLVMAVVLYFLRLNNSPNEAKIKTSQIESEASSSARFIPLSTSYFDLIYNDKYSLVAEQPSTDYLVSFSDSKNEAQFLQLTVRNAPQGGIVLDKDYKNYQSQLQTYKFSQKFFGQEPVILTTKQSGKEENALWLHGNYILAIKMKDNLTKEQLDTQLKDMLASVQWKK